MDFLALILTPEQHKLVLEGASQLEKALLASSHLHAWCAAYEAELAEGGRQPDWMDDEDWWGIQARVALRQAEGKG